jgi:hypothetical protein
VHVHLDQPLVVRTVEDDECALVVIVDLRALAEALCVFQRQLRDLEQLGKLVEGSGARGVEV